MRLGIDKPVPREEWDRYSRINKFMVCRVVCSYGGNVVRARDSKTGLPIPPLKEFVKLEDAEFYLQYEKTVNDHRYLAIFEILEITAERVR